MPKSFLGAALFAQSPYNSEMMHQSGLLIPSSEMLSPTGPATLGQVALAPPLGSLYLCLCLLALCHHYVTIHPHEGRHWPPWAL